MTIIHQKWRVEVRVGEGARRTGLAVAVLIRVVGGDSQLVAMQRGPSNDRLNPERRGEVRRAVASDRLR
jgi:protein tyrosine/serine phosphatase